MTKVGTDLPKYVLAYGVILDRGNVWASPTNPIMDNSARNKDIATS